MSLGRLRVLTAGESHGPQLTIFVENLPAGMPVLAEDINVDLARRQKGYGRGGRQQIEHDCVEIVAGVRHGRTMGGPIAMVRRLGWGAPAVVGASLLLLTLLPVSSELSLHGVDPAPELPDERVRRGATWALRLPWLTDPMLTELFGAAAEISTDSTPDDRAG